MRLEVRRFGALVVDGFVADLEVLVVRAAVVIAAVVVRAAVYFEGRLLAVVDSCWD